MKFLEFFHTQQTKTSTIQNKINGLNNNKIETSHNITSQLLKISAGLFPKFFAKFGMMSYQFRAIFRESKYG